MPNKPDILDSLRRRIPQKSELDRDRELLEQAAYEIERLRAKTAPPPADKTTADLLNEASAIMYRHYRKTFGDKRIEAVRTVAKQLRDGRGPTCCFETTAPLSQ